MNERQAINAFSALAQENRLRIVRQLVKAGPQGLAAGEIAEAVGASPSNASFHLKELERGGLIESRRSARSVIYSAAYPALSGLVEFLMRDCCEGHPEVCAPALAALAAATCAADEERPMSNRTFNVLFLCTGNSARSIMAESMLRHLGNGRFNAYSAGSHPRGAVNPLALKTLESFGFPTDQLRSKGWDEFAAPGAPVMDFVLTVCDQAAGEACPVWPGQPMTAHWGIEDPSAVQGPEIEKERAFVLAAKYLRNRISVFVSLPIASLDEIALHNRLRAIGEMEGASPTPAPLTQAVG